MCVRAPYSLQSESIAFVLRLLCFHVAITMLSYCESIAIVMKEKRKKNCK